MRQKLNGSTLTSIHHHNRLNREFRDWRDKPEYLKWLEAKNTQPKYKKAHIAQYDDTRMRDLHQLQNHKMRGIASFMDTDSRNLID